MTRFFQIVLAQVIATIVGILFIIFCVTEMAKGSSETRGFARRYFASSPILFSCIGGINLTMGLFFCFAVLIAHYVMPNRTLWIAGVIGTWITMSLVSYLIGRAGQKSRDACSIPRVKGPEQLQIKFTCVRKVQPENGESDN
jgi:uncharacterized membrane protein